MAYSFANNPLLRKHFAKSGNIIDIPNLIDIQKTSYKRFLQADLPSSARRPIGLESVFRSVFPLRLPRFGRGIIASQLKLASTNLTNLSPCSYDPISP